MTVPVTEDTRDAVARFQEARQRFAVATFAMQVAYENVIVATGRADFGAAGYPVQESFDEFAANVEAWAWTEPE
jgi:hypothetical protein